MSNAERAAWRRGAFIGLLGAVVLASPAARAAEPLWELGLGLGALRLPHYRGSDQSHHAVFPVPYAVYRGEIFKADRDGARAVLLDSARYEVDLSVNASPPTRSRDNRAREGMASLSGSFELGPKLSLTLARGAGWALDLRAPVHGVVTLERSPRWLGWSVAPFLNLDTTVAGWKFGALAGPVWNSRGVNALAYEVGPTDATATRPAYAARAGFAGWQGTVGVSKREGRLWWGAFARADSVAGAVFEGSPLVRQRSHVSAGVAVAWVFAQSATLVNEGTGRGP